METGCCCVKCLSRENKILKDKISKLQKQLYRKSQENNKLKNEIKYLKNPIKSIAPYIHCKTDSQISTTSQISNTSSANAVSIPFIPTPLSPINESQSKTGYYLPSRAPSLSLVTFSDENDNLDFDSYLCDDVSIDKSFNNNVNKHIGHAFHNPTTTKQNEIQVMCPIFILFFC